MKIVFDIECVADQRAVADVEKRKLIAGWAARRAGEHTPEQYCSLTPPLAQVVSIAWVAMGNDLSTTFGGCYFDDRHATLSESVPYEFDDVTFTIEPVLGEVMLLDSFTRRLGHHASATSTFAHLISWFGRGYDLPVLISRSLKHGIDNAGTDILNAAWREHRFRHDLHTDLADVMTQYGAVRGVPMGAFVMGLDGPQSKVEDVEGSSVGDLYANGETLRIAEYNCRDAGATAWMFRTLFKGKRLP